MDELIENAKALTVEEVINSLSGEASKLLDLSRSQLSLSPDDNLRVVDSLREQAREIYSLRDRIWTHALTMASSNQNQNSG